MVNFVSPGVYVIEKDISDYTPAVNPTVVGIVGFASKGPTNKATLITSQESLVKTFGRPQEALAGQGLEGALEILETANQTYFVRSVATSGADEASAVLGVGSCPVIAVSANDYGVTKNLYLKMQVTNNAGVNQFTTPRSYAIPSGTLVGGVSATSQAQALRGVIGGSLDSDPVGAYYVSSDSTLADENGAVSAGTFLVGNFAGSGATLSVSAYTDSAYTTEASGVLLTVDGSGSVSGDGTVGGIIPVDSSGWARSQTGYSISSTPFSTAARAGLSSLNYLVESLHPGTGYNLSTLADGSVQGNSVTVSPLGSDKFVVNINDDGVTEESFTTSFLASGAFIEQVINTGSTDLKSNLIKGNLIAEGAIFTDTALTHFQNHVSALNAGATHFKGSGGGATITGLPAAKLSAGGGFTTSTLSVSADKAINPRFVKLIEGTTSLASGTNGDGGGDTDQEATALIGVTSPSRTGMQALNDELVPITIGIVPGITDQRVQNALITLAETQGDFLTVFGTPIGIGNPGDAIDYANGQTSYRSTAFNSSYACLYYPAVKVFQSYMAKDIWMDPAIFAVRQMGFTDSVADLWFAPAGFVRGRLTKPIDTEVDINQGDRDSLYSGGNIVNPIVNFAQQGITIFGQRTTQREPTALDRINVRRLMVYIKRVITASTQRFIFEPNDKITQERIQTLLVPLFEDIKRRRGITEFKVICDETVNTPVRVDRNELWCKVLIKPTKAAEVLVFELNITNQSANIG
mgnify:CR=1 FL=1|tara:strand:+ start:4949 stop:7195 length:2247 start_codon:yes stop_codon:yes gene_type:complete